MTNGNPTERTIEIARALGFDLCGIAPAAEFPELAHLEEWLERGYAGEMRYLYDERRHSPARAMQGARSVIVCALNYNAALPASTDARITPEENTGPRGWIARRWWMNSAAEGWVQAACVNRYLNCTKTTLKEIHR